MGRLLEAVVSVFLLEVFRFGMTCHAAPGDLDPTFNTTGVYQSSFTFGYDAASATALQPDGKYVVVGTSENGRYYWMTAVRYNTNGSLDDSFGNNGKVFVEVEDIARGYAVALQTDGKIVLAGQSGATFGLVRLNTDGTLDASFGNGGRVSTSFGEQTFAAAFAVAIQSDGKIVAAGYEGTLNSPNDIALARYHPNGSLDLDFGFGGTVTTEINSSDDEARAVVLQSDGKVLVAGFDRKAGNLSFVLLRYLNNGFLDSSFGSGGKVLTAFNTSSSAAAMTLQTSPTSTKILLAGVTSTGSNSDFALARYNLADGSLDTSFGSGGKVVTDFGSGSADVATAIQVIYQSGLPNRIVVSGYSKSGGGSNEKFALAQYLLNGTLDPSFNNTGKVTTALTSGDSRGQAMVLQSGRVTVAGYAGSSTTGDDFALARYNGDGSLDVSFDGDGVRIDNYSQGISADANAVIVQPDQKVVVVGGAFIPTSVFYPPVFALARLNADGSPDTSFGTNGRVTTALNYLYNRQAANAVVLQPNGKIVVAGEANDLSVSKTDFAAARYNSDGSLDTTFNSAGYVETSTGTGDAMANSLAVQADGKIVLAGISNDTPDSGGPSKFALVRYNTNGSLDPAFGGTGIVTSSLGTDSEANAVAIQPNGKIVVSGFIDGNFAVVRYNTNGSLDPSFGAGGKVTTAIGSSGSYCFAMVLYPDGRVLAAGGTYSGSNEYVALARYNPDGSLDSTFGTGGIVTTNTGTSMLVARALALQKDGKIMVGASSNGQSFALIRYRTDGSLDQSYGNGGIAFHGFESPARDYLKALALDGLGRAVVAGSTANDLVGVARVVGDPIVAITSIARRPGDGHIILDGLALPTVSNSLEQAPSVNGTTFSLLTSVLPDAAGNWEADVGLPSSPHFYKLTSP